MAVDTGDKVTRKYSNFRGVDFRGEDCSLNRSPDALNVWRNYKKLSSIETRPGLEVFFNPTYAVKSIKWHGGKFYYIGGDGNNAKVFEWNKDTKEETPICDVADGSFFIDYGGKLYVHLAGWSEATNKDGIVFNTCLYNVSERKLVEPYIPTTTRYKPPSGGGEKYQDINMLSPFRINTFRGIGDVEDNSGRYFYLDEQSLDEDFMPIVKVDGVFVFEGKKLLATIKRDNWIEYRYSEFDNGYKDMMAVYHKEGYIFIVKDGKALRKPYTDGADNISILFKVYSRTTDKNADTIMKCTMAQEFDNHLFFSGNSEYPNMVWHSSLNNPSYVSVLDYYEDGKDSAPIRSLVAGNNALWVFRDAETTNGVFYHVPTPDAEYGAVYPSSHSSIALGCVGRAINFNDDIVFFSRRGMESASTDITTEQFATHKSSVVDRKMLTNDNYKDMVLAEWEGYLLVFIGNEVYLADSRAMLTNENHYEYEWYYWKLFKDKSNVSVKCATVHDGVLYIGTERDIYAFTGDLKDGDVYQMCIDSYWTTPKDKFGAVNKLKTTNKKGCVVEATGNVDVYAKVEDTDFELIGTNDDVEDYFVSRIKRKKFKDIQLKFQSQTSFCLESATLECFVGGYIKR